MLTLPWVVSEFLVMNSQAIVLVGNLTPNSFPFATVSVFVFLASWSWLLHSYRKWENKKMIPFNNGAQFETGSI